MNDEIPYNPPGLDEYIRDGARRNSALLLRCQDARARGVEDAIAGRCRAENLYAGQGVLGAAWLEGYNSVNPPDADAAARAATEPARPSGRGIKSVRQLCRGLELLITKSA